MNFHISMVFCAFLALVGCGQTGQLELPPGFGNDKSNETRDPKPDEKPTPKSAQ